MSTVGKVSGDKTDADATLNRPTILIQSYIARCVDISLHAHGAAGVGGATHGPRGTSRSSSSARVRTAQVPLLQRLLIHFLDEHVDVIRHALQILSQQLVLGPQELLLLLIIRQRFENLRCLTHLFNL